MESNYGSQNWVTSNDTCMNYTQKCMHLAILNMTGPVEIAQVTAMEHICYIYVHGKSYNTT